MINYRKIAASILVLLLASSINNASAFADGLEVPAKHVCIVYDDSGSMYEAGGEPIMDWARVNYMVQAFCALLNAQDSLFITYMSDIEGSLGHGDYMQMDRAYAIEEIRSWQGDDQTPFAAVEAAYQTLSSIEGKSGDEYWLVIMTDGQFQDQKVNLGDALHGYIDEMMQAGKTLKIVFLAMGEDTQPPEADDGAGLMVYKTGEYGIITTMLALADNISARQAIPYSDIRVDGSRISFNLPIAPASIVILNQESRNPVKAIKNSDGVLKPHEQFNIAAPDSFLRQNSLTALTDGSLSGTVMHVGTGTGYLAAGKYTITFENQVDIEKLRILYRPAISLKLRYLSQGKIVENPKDGIIVDIQSLLVNSATGMPFDASILGGELSYSIKLIADGEVISTEPSALLEGVCLVSGETSIAAEASLPGYFSLRSRFDYQEQPEILPQDSSYEDSGPWPPEITLAAQPGQYALVGLNDLENAAFTIKAYYNGEPATQDDLQKSKLEIICPRNVEFTYSVSPEGSFILKPHYGGDMLSTSTGSISTTLVYTSQYGSKTSTTLSFVIEDLSWLQRNIKALTLPFILAFIALLLSGILFFHRRFAKSGGIEYTHFTKNRSGQWQQTLQTSVATFENLKGPWTYIPFSSERINVSGVTFLPGKNDRQLYISLKQSDEEIYTEPKDALARKKNSNLYILRANVNLIIERDDYKITLRYIAPKRSMIRHE